MKNSGARDKHINNNLKIVMSFANFSDQNLSFGDMNRQHLIQFLDNKIKSIDEDDKHFGKICLSQICF